jgi:hypothetical protein
MKSVGIGEEPPETAKKRKHLQRVPGTRFELLCFEIFFAVLRGSSSIFALLFAGSFRDLGPGHERPAMQLERKNS